MDYEITGTIAQHARIQLQKNEALWAGRGTIMSYSQGIEWVLRIPGGVGGALKRSFAGEGISLVRITAVDHNQQLMLSNNAPGHIKAWDLAQGPVITTRGSFLAAWGQDIDINVTVARRAGAALFGGSGLFLQQISGKGTVLIFGSGDFYEQTLAPGERILVSTGNLAAFSQEIDYDIQGVGGCRKSLFGGEGFFMTSLTGPGRIFLQTLKRTPISTSTSQAGS